MLNLLTPMVGSMVFIGGGIGLGTILLIIVLIVLLRR
jgi:hypothetical protein